MVEGQRVIDGTALDWFDSYLTDQTQSFQQGAQRSELYRVHCSVPQDSVLGPEEFIAYTEDLDDLIERHHLSRYLYADDTQLIDGVRIVEISVAIERLQQLDPCAVEFRRRTTSNLFGAAAVGNLSSRRRISSAPPPPYIFQRF